MKRFLLLAAAALLSATTFAADEDKTPKQIQADEGKTPEQILEEVRIATTPTERPRWKKRYDAKRQEAKELGAKAKILFLGDSITHLWETRGKEVFERDFKPYNTIDAGFSGDRTEHLIWVVEKSGILDPLDPQLIVMMIGTNNAGHRLKNKGGTGTTATVAGIRRALGSVRARFPKAKILLFAIFPRGRNASDRARQQNEQVNHIIRNFADGKDVIWVDINDKLMNPDGTIDKEMMPDKLHPQKKGYEIWSAAILPYAKQYVK